MGKFITEDFLLSNETAKELYHGVAKDLPIVDYHNHIVAEELLSDKPFDNLTELWLETDHYKWRAMRANGIEESLITGEVSEYDKFLAWAKTIPNMFGNPLYHWTHQELKNYLGIEELLNEQTAPSIWKQAQENLAETRLSPRKIMKMDKIEFLGTTDDPTDDLKSHQALQEEDIGVLVAPTFRPDNGLEIGGNHFVDWVNKLAQVTDQSIQSYDELLMALDNRIDYFSKHGCRSSDHSLSQVFFKMTTKTEVESIFDKRLRGEKLTTEEIAQYKTYTLLTLGEKYAEQNWVMQLHIGARRNNNTRMYEKLGPDSGFDSIEDYHVINYLGHLLDALEEKQNLPKTILYGLNPKDQYTLATMAGNFQSDDFPGKIQLGAAWWFNDHIEGIETQMKVLAQTGLLRHFVGMLTDSRSFLSFSRHEYFRRILCNFLGASVEDGTIPNDRQLLEAYVRDICYKNAKRYFNINDI